MIRKQTVQLGAQEHQILRAMARSRSVPLSSTQRLRFELLGLIEDRADGMALTELGRRLAEQPAPAAPGPRKPEEIHRDAPRDKRGRRLGHQRQTPF
ncbi:MAG: hypothetical protein U1E23_05665 [Reyranellaceae bacterium]